MSETNQAAPNPKGRKPGRDLRWARNEVKQWLGSCYATGGPIGEVYQEWRRKRYEKALALITAHKLANS